MSKAYPGPWILRTVLFTAGHSEKFIHKAFASDADCVVLDLEDAVPDNSKAIARDTVKTVLKAKGLNKQPIMVRINPLESGLTLLDLERVACKELSGFVYPKAYCPDDIKAFDAQLTLKEKTLGLNLGHFDIIVLIETPRAVLSAYEIATASSRVIGLLFGCEDFLTDMEGFHGPEGRSIFIPRHIISMAARAAGVVPIDTPYIQVKDIEGLKAHINQARELGFEGMLVMTPGQIQIARELFTPSEEEVTNAKEIVRLASEAAEENRGIARFGKVFISPPTYKRAQRILRRKKTIKAFEDIRRYQTEKMNAIKK